MIRTIMLTVFSVPHSDVVFTWLSGWHFAYTVLIFGGVAAMTRYSVRRCGETAYRSVRFLGYAVPMIYIADFFLMPFASEYAGIEVIKLPFHMCTVLAAVIPFVQFNPRFRAWKPPVAVLSVTCSFLFLLYPGTSLGNYAPWCYLVVQTLVFHGCLLLWGVLTVVSNTAPLSFHTLKRVCIVTVAVIVWASFGNAAYSHDNVQYDWFMLTGQSLPFFVSKKVERILPLLMPFVVFGVVVSVSSLVIVLGRRLQRQQSENKTAQVSS